MADEVVITSGRKLALGSDWAEIRDDGSPVVFVDLLTEARQANGVVALSFASSLMDANNPTVAQIACRMRMNLGTAQFLHKMLGDMISDALKPIDQSKAN